MAILQQAQIQNKVNIFYTVTPEKSKKYMLYVKMPSSANQDSREEDFFKWEYFSIG